MYNKYYHLLNPVEFTKFLFKHRYVHFFLTGVTGVGINLGVTWLLTTFYFGLENYFSAYLIGIALNLVYNFTLHTIITFGTKKHHTIRFVVFIVYSLVVTFFQALVVKVITPIVGLQYYLLVIAIVIFLLSTINFLLFKFYLFNNNNKKYE